MARAEIELIGRTQLVEIGEKLAGPPKEGSFYIDDYTVLLPGYDSSLLLNWLMGELARLYPEYTWCEVSALRPSERLGLLIEWTPRRNYIPPATVITQEREIDG